MEIKIGAQMSFWVLWTGAVLYTDKICIFQNLHPMKDFMENIFYPPAIAKGCLCFNIFHEI